MLSGSFMQTVDVISDPTQLNSTTTQKEWLRGKKLKQLIKSPIK